MALNPKQLLFVKEYLVDQNATQAAKRAGYSQKTAGSQGHDLLKVPEIAAAIGKGLSEQTKKLEQKAAKVGLTKERWLLELRRIAFANMDDFATVETQTKMEYAGEDEPPHEYEVQTVNLVPTMERKVGRGHAIKKITQTITQHGGSLGIELHDKKAALELIGKAYGWVKDEHDVRFPDGAPQVVLQIYKNGSEAEE
jgi:phage terminase small subunit